MSKVHPSTWCSEEAEEFALRVIGVVDYDIERECRRNIEEFGEDNLVDEMIGYLENVFE